jgi:hypothetical protein
MALFSQEGLSDSHCFIILDNWLILDINEVIPIQEPLEDGRFIICFKNDHAREVTHRVITTLYPKTIGLFLRQIGTNETVQSFMSIFSLYGPV